MAPQNNVVIGVIAVCVLIGASFATYQYGYTAGSASQTRSAPSASVEQRMVFGTIDTVVGQEITLSHFQKVSPGPVAGAVTDPSGTMTVTVGRQTTIQRLTSKDVAVIQKEQADFAKRMQVLGSQGTTTPLAPPDPFIRENIALKDLKAGDVVMAYAGEDVSNLSAFTAVKIELQTSLPTPTPQSAVGSR